jgi:hypothetical protein
VRIGDDATPEDCPLGGFRLIAGRDGDDDGQLAAGEIRAIAHLCHRAGFVGAAALRRGQRSGEAVAVSTGAAAASATRATSEMLMRIDDDGAGPPCPGRASRTASGLDGNRNGLLEASEVEVTQLACGGSGLPGATHVARVMLPGVARVGATMLVSGGVSAWNIVQGSGQRINTERLRGPWGSGWSATGPAARGSAIALSADGGRIVVAGDVSLLHSTDSGASWQALAPAGSAGGWAGVASSRDGRLLAASSRTSGIYLSADGGHGWVRVVDGDGWGRLAASADLRSMVAIRHGRQLWVSDDGGRSWLRAAPEDDWTALATSADGRIIAAAAGDAPLRLSRDAGRTWQPVHDTAGTTAVAITGDTRQMIIIAAHGSSQMRRSEDGGQTWQALRGPWPTRSGWAALATSAHGRTIVAASAAGQLWSSVDSGSTWQVERTAHRVSAVAVTAEGLGRVALTDGGRILRAAEATTPGPSGALSIAAGQPVGLRHVGMGVWSVLTATGTFHVQ